MRSGSKIVSDKALLCHFSARDDNAITGWIDKGIKFGIIENQLIMLLDRLSPSRLDIDKASRCKRYTGMP